MAPLHPPAPEFRFGRFNPLQPRGPGGRWISSGGLLAGHVEPEGFSLDPRTGKAPEHGFMVSLPGHTHQYPDSVMKDPHALAEAIDHMLMSEREAFSKPGVYLGGWVSDGKLRLDPSENITDRDAAMKAGRARDQVAIWDVQGGQEIDTGGTGGEVVSHALPADPAWLSRLAGAGAQGSRSPPGSGAAEAAARGAAAGLRPLVAAGLRGPEFRDYKTAYLTEPRDPHTGKWLSTGGAVKSLKDSGRPAPHPKPAPDPVKLAALTSRVQAKADEMAKSHAVGADLLEQFAAYLKRDPGNVAETTQYLAPIRFSPDPDLVDWATETQKMVDDINGVAPLAEKAPSAPVPASVRTFVTKAAKTVPSLIGASTSRWNGRIDIQRNLGPGVVAAMGWDGTLQMQQEAADGLDGALSGSGPVSAVPFETVLHEMIHSVSGSGADQRAYRDSMTAASMEEGFTELATLNHLSAFVQQMGVGGRPDSDVGVKGGGGRKSLTLGQYAQQQGRVSSITGGKGFYPDEREEAESWVISVAAAELPGGDAPSDARLVQLADEVARAGVAGKPQVLASQLLRALKIPPSQAALTAAQTAIMARWFEHNAFDAASAAATQARSYDTSRRTGEADRPVGVRGPEGPRGRGAGAGESARGQGYRPGAARGAGLRHDADAAPVAPVFRGYEDAAEARWRFNPLQPRDPHTGKWSLGGSIADIAFKADAKLHRHPAAPKAAPLKGVGGPVSPEAEKALITAEDSTNPGTRYSAGFTQAQDMAAQAATRRALLQFSQQRILKALNTPPEQMSDEQVQIASRVLNQISGSTIQQVTDSLQNVGLPGPITDHVKSKMDDLRGELARENNADARGTLIRHMAAIAATVGLTLASMGLAVPAVIAAVVTTLPALIQEFSDFKAEWDKKAAAASKIAHGATSAASMAAPVKRAYLAAAELRTAETPAASTVHHPFGSPAGPGLFRVKGLQLPAYIQNVAHAFARDGATESEAIARAVGVVRDWAEGRTPDGKGHVHPDVQAAAARAIAEWDADKAAAGGSKRRSAIVSEYRAELSTADINNLPDSAFAHIEPGGTKDSEGKTTPRTLRHYPVHDAAHIRNALGRAGNEMQNGDPQAQKIARAAMPKIQAAAKQMGIGGALGASDDGRALVAMEEVREVRITSQYQDIDSRLEVRMAPDGGRWIGGYAAVFRPRTSRNLGGFVEQVDPSAFSEARAAGWRNVVCRYNHDNNMVLGTTDSGTLQLHPDGVGLDYQVLPPESRSDVRELVERGDIRFSSFAFRCSPGGDEWGITEQNFPRRILHDVTLIDVAPVLTPAYPDATAAVRATSPALRSLADHMQISVDEVRNLAENDELRTLFIRTDRPIYRPEPKRLFGPAAALTLLARREDPYA